MLLRFRAPGVRLRAEALLARVLPEVPARERQRLLAGGALRRAGPAEDEEKGWAPGDPQVDPGAWIEPASAWLLDAPARPTPTLSAPRLHGLAPRLPYVAGELPGGVGFEETAQRDGIACLRLSLVPEGQRLDAETAAAALAGAGAPLLGDLQRGGVAAAGGLALWADAAAAPPWPKEPMFAPDLEKIGDAVLRVSRETRRALARGHPWVLRDAETGDTGGYRPGARLRIAGGFEVRIEPTGPVAARVWARGQPADLAARVAAAFERRAPLRRGAPPASQALRLIHGEADGLPGLHLDRLGPLLRLLVTARCAEPVVPELVEAVNAQLAREGEGEPSWISAVCLRRPPPGRFRGVVHRAGPQPPLDTDGRLLVEESGLRFWVDPGLAAPERPRPGVGLFLDQRENRARVAGRVRRGGRYLNLFAHTGAFSVALLAAGAGEVVSVDLSAAYLRWLEANLAANGFAGSPHHRAQRSDGRRFLEALASGERFDGIVLDPPTAAAVGRRFWNVRRDLEPLAQRAFGHLAPGGWLLLARNDRAARATWGEGLARRAGLQVTAAPPGADFPSLEGFPEGDPFRAWLFSRR